MTLMIIHCTIPSMHVRILVLMVVGRGLGFVLGDTACPPLSSFLRFSGVDDDVDDACMDGV